MSPDAHNELLDRWAKRDAAKAIMSDLGISSLHNLYRIVAEARAMHDPRAVNRRISSGRTMSAKWATRKVRETAKAERRSAVAGWWFGKETMMVRRLGVGSADCLLVPVSVSCVPQKAAKISSGAHPSALTLCRSFAEAMAKHPLGGPLSLSGDPSQP